MLCVLVCVGVCVCVGVGECVCGWVCGCECIGCFYIIKHAPSPGIDTTRYNMTSYSYLFIGREA